MNASHSLTAFAAPSSFVEGADVTFIGALLAGAAMLAPISPARKGCHMLNVWTVRNGGIRFVRVGRLFFSFGVSRDVRPLGSK